MSALFRFFIPRPVVSTGGPPSGSDDFSYAIDSGLVAAICL